MGQAVRPRSTLSSATLVAGTLIASSFGGASPAAAADVPIGSTTVVAVLEENESVWPIGPTSVVRSNFGGGTSIIDVFTGERNNLELPADLDLVSVSDDGATIIANSQSDDLVAGDDDDGLHDAYRYDVATGTTTSVTAALTGRASTAIDASADGSIVLLRSAPFAAPSESTNWVSRNGSLTELTALPPANVFDFAPNTRLSDDGSAVYGVRLAGPTQIAFHLDLDTSVLSERPIRGYQGIADASDDGDVLSWLEIGPSDSTGNQQTTLAVWSVSANAIERSPLRSGSYQDRIVMSGDGSTAFTIRSVYGSNTSTTSAVSIDTATGAVQIIATDPFYDGINQLLAADQTGSKVAFLGIDNSDLDVYDEYRQSVFVWDENGTPAPPFMSPVMSDQIERLYQAYFGRAPDSGGLDFWVGRRVDGLTLADVSQAFAASPEFTSTYGSLADGAFVDLVYQNVLGRLPDAAGRAFWVGRLEGGQSRGSVMIGFSESPEYASATNTSPPMSPNQAAVERLYRAFFVEAPTADEAATWTAFLDGGNSLSALGGALAQSPKAPDVSTADRQAVLIDRVLFTRFPGGPTEAVYDDLGSWYDAPYVGTFDLVTFMLAVADHPEFARVTGLPRN